ncbi:hypothetical protein PS467_17540 [Streptomyces luomodiensis]|uniref:Uncharacterized protein n=1 Tax=Streptomyces luomodiensis TaxID=3026192 RepID=A0ABY9UYV8_9ACTN|nr:hypothetical protein [Streptomyces sp. SCA4-21]WNE97005.1 hypothetical protein PS467_17540 [Streptomyces sp. SCA4-21]
MRRRVSAAAVALLLGGGGVLLGAGTAQGAEVSYQTECIPPAISGLPPVEGTTTVAVTAPETAKVGDEVEVVWKTVKAASTNPPILDLEANTVLPTGTITVGGAQTGELSLEGPRENPAIPKGAEMKLSDMKGKLKLTKAGEVTLTPGAYNINVSKPLSTDTKCSAKEAVKAAATIKVTDDGDDSGGTTSGTSSGTTSGTTSGTSSGTSSSGTTSGTTGGGDGGDDPFTGKEVQVAYACKTPIGDKNATSPVQINATKNGGNFDLTVKFGKSVMDSPADIPADSVKPSMAVKVGGADKGTVAVEGPTNKEPIKSGDPMEIPNLTGTYKPGATGTSTLTPGVLTVKALGTTTTCTPSKDPGVSLELDTTGQPGGTTGGDTSGGTSGGDTSGGSSGSGGSGTSGGLAETGANDHGGLKALALIAGTTVLLGGAIFVLTPWRRLRGTTR